VGDIYFLIGSGGIIKISPKEIFLLELFIEFFCLFHIEVRIFLSFFVFLFLQEQVTWTLLHSF